MLLRRPPRVFYGSREEAEADGMIVSERDICPATLRVNRLGGLRGDGRDLWRRLTARPGSEPMNCVVMAPLDEWAESPVRSLLDDATLIVPAFGYRAATVPVYDVDGTRIRLRADLGRPAVGRDARVLTESGSAIDNLFGIGLGTGYRPWGHMGGEPAFDGQANSLWLYQNHIGEIVFRGVEEIRNSIDRAPRLASHRLVTGSDSSDRVRSVRLTRDGRPSRRDAFR